MAILQLRELLGLRSAVNGLIVPGTANGEPRKELAA
jgi:hypothetical protein